MGARRGLPTRRWLAVLSDEKMNEVYEVVQENEEDADTVCERI